MKRFGALAVQIKERKIPLSDAQLNYLAEAFEKISLGCPPDIALGLKYTAGRSKSKEISVENRALVIHWMYCAMQPTKEGGHGLDLDQAINAAMQLAEGEWLNPTNGDLISNRDSQGNINGLEPYTYASLEKMWSARENQRFKTLNLSPLVVGSPYDIKKYST
jgi:hypothetical protein